MKQRIYLPSSSQSARLSMGLQPLSLADWIEVDEHFERYLALKKQLHDRYHSQVCAGLAGSQDAQQEVLERLLDHLLLNFPRQYQKQGDEIQNLITKEIFSIKAFSHHPLELAGRLIQEDLCLMQSMSGNYVLSAASLCFPFHWKLQDKLGKPLAQIHDPVPGYRKDLERPVDHFFDRLKSNHPVYRLNWGLANTPNLSLDYVREYNQQPATSLTVDNISQHLWLRIERQTLRRLEKTQSVLFTIRTYIYPLSILENYPSAADNLMTRIQHASDDMLGYKSILAIQEPLLAYLQRIQLR